MTHFVSKKESSIKVGHPTKVFYIVEAPIPNEDQIGNV